MDDLHFLSLADVCRRIKSGELTARAVTEHMLARIADLDPALGAYVTVTDKDALARAEHLDQERHDGKPLGPLHGVPPCACEWRSNSRNAPRNQRSAALPALKTVVTSHLTSTFW